MNPQSEMKQNCIRWSSLLILCDLHPYKKKTEFQKLFDWNWYHSCLRWFSLTEKLRASLKALLLLRPKLCFCFIYKLFWLLILITINNLISCTSWFLDFFFHYIKFCRLLESLDKLKTASIYLFPLDSETTHIFKLQSSFAVISNYGNRNYRCSHLTVQNIKPKSFVIKTPNFQSKY